VLCGVIAQVADSTETPSHWIAYTRSLRWGTSLGTVSALVNTWGPRSSSSHARRAEEAAALPNDVDAEVPGRCVPPSPRGVYAIVAHLR
jgi:hypothetical protein